MRTTINLPDGLAEAAKDRARREGRTFTSLIEDGLRRVLGEPEAAPHDATPLPAFGQPGERFLIDLEDKNALWEALGEPELHPTR